MFDEPEAEEGDDLHGKLEDVMASLQAEAKRRVDRRTTVEQRWLDDLRQYHGVYDPVTQEDLRRDKGEPSRIFINMTKVKTDALVARIWDILFPTDDRHWAIEPTPVPELADVAQQAAEKRLEARGRANAAQEDMTSALEQGQEEIARQQEAVMRAAEEEESAAEAAHEEATRIMDEARTRSRLMLDEIDDQLTEGRWPTVARQVIEDACRMGIGIVKGPIAGDRPIRRWRQGEEGFDLETVADMAPMAERVSPWDYFPDPDAPWPEDSEGIYQRHLLTKKQLRDMARWPQVNVEAIREILKTTPGEDMPSYYTELAALTSQNDGEIKDRYCVWEYSGPLEPEEQVVIRRAMGEQDITVDDIDPVDDLHVRMFFGNGRVIRFMPYPLDRQDPLYSTYLLDEDETSPYGYGIPYRCRHPQSMLNGAARMLMDNAALASGPQIVVDQEAVEPEDGEWLLKAKKVWRRRKGEIGGATVPFEAFNIPFNQGGLQAIIDLAMQLMDEVTAMPRIAQGEQGAGVTKTAQGMALLMNSANVTFRRFIKAFDDGVTMPLIRRFYDWNMQFSDKDDIKGDMEVKARGAGALLVREMQAQNLILVAQTFGQDPRFAPWLREENMLKAVIRTQMLPVDEIVKSKAEYTEDMEAAAAQPNPEIELQQESIALKREEMELKREEIQSRVAIAEMESNARIKVARLTYDAQMEKTAADLNDRAQGRETEGERKDRAMAVEVAMKQRTGDSSGGSI